MLALFLSFLCIVGAFVTHYGGDDMTSAVFTVLAVIFLLAAADSTGDDSWRN